MKLHEYLTLAKMTQLEFSKKINKSQTLVSGYCTGTLIPPRATALKIVKITKGVVTLGDLWGIKVA